MEQAADVNTRRFNVSWFTNEPLQQEHPNCPHAFYNFWKEKKKERNIVTTLPNGLAQRQGSRLVYGKCLVRISDRAQAILVAFRGSPQILQVNTTLLP
jgi:hypothetical protein